MGDRKGNIDLILSGLGNLGKGQENQTPEEKEVDELAAEALDEGYDDEGSDESLVEDVPEEFDIGENDGVIAEPSGYPDYSEDGEEQPVLENPDDEGEGEAQDEKALDESEPEEEGGENGGDDVSAAAGNNDDSSSGSEEGLPSEDGSEEGDEGSDAASDDDDYDSSDDGYGNYNLEDYDSDILDPEDEAVEYSRGQDEMTAEVLFGSSADDDADEASDDDDEEVVVEKKRNPLDVLGVKKKKEVPKLAKTKLMVVLGVTVLVFLMIFNLGFLSDKEKKEKKGSEETMGVEGYRPDFGDYASREYKPTKKDKEKADLEYAERLLHKGEPEKPAPEPSSQVQSQPQYGAVQDNSEAVAYWKTARDSPIRYSGSGFGSRNVDEGGLLDKMGLSGVSSPPASPQNYQPMSYDQYANGYMDRLQKLASGVSGMGGSGTDKYDRINNGRFSQDGAYDRNAEGGQLSAIPEYSLYPGTIIPAVLVSGINTDYPGNITARITSPVYDSRTGKNLLIPQGSILRGSYSSSSIGIAKVQIAWQTLVINRDGSDYLVNLGSMVGVDARGYSGIKGSLNDHFFQYVKAAGISSLFTYINSNIYSYTKAQKSATLQQMISDSQDIGNKLADKLLDRALDIQPTVVVKPGTKVYVDVDQVLTLLPQSVDVPVQKYRK